MTTWTAKRATHIYVSIQFEPHNEEPTAWVCDNDAMRKVATATTRPTHNSAIQSSRMLFCFFSIRIYAHCNWTGQFFLGVILVISE